MFSSRTFVISVGNNGTIIALHSKKTIISKTFVEELNDASKKDLEKIFKNNKKVPIYILLDTVDQSYKKKIYPSISKSDINKLAKRDLASDGDSQSIKNYLLLSQKKIKEKKQAQSVKWNLETGAKLECLFVSASSTDFLVKWTDYVIELPNRVVGIYMLPIETYSLFQAIKLAIDNRSKIKNKKNDIYIMLLQNKICGVRQIVFNNQGILFTRVVRYDLDNEFKEKFEQDIYSTFEYIKRLYRDIKLSEVDIINIFDEKILNILKSTGNIELNYINLTPNQICREIGNEKMLPANVSNCDLLISNIFVNSKKILKFSNPKIANFEQLFFISQSIHYFNSLLIFGIIIAIIVNLFIHQGLEKEIEEFESQRLQATEELSKVKKLFSTENKENSDENADSQEKIEDLGKMQEIFGNISNKYIELYNKLKFLKNYKVVLERFIITGGSINTKVPSQIPSYQIAITANLFNPNGDIDDLFGLFDDVNLVIKKEYEGNEIRIKEMSRDMDFTKKYYSYPLNFEINKMSP